MNGRTERVYDERKQKEILGDAIQEDGSLYSLGWYLHWKPGSNITLDGKFTVEELRVIVRYIENFKKVKI